MSAFHLMFLVVHFVPALLELLISMEIASIHVVIVSVFAKHALCKELVNFALLDTF